LKVVRDIFEWSAKLKNDYMKVGVSAEPEGWNGVDKNLKLEHDSKFTPESSLYEGTGTLHWGSPKLGPLRIWLTVSVLFPDSFYFIYDILAPQAYK